MQKTLPVLFHDSSRGVDVKVFDKVKSNIFFKVLKHTENNQKIATLLPRKGDSNTTSKESLYEKIRSFQQNSSFQKIQGKKPKFDVFLFEFSLEKMHFLFLRSRNRL